jgi:hypothetical protein
MVLGEVAMTSEYICVTVHSEALKFGRVPDPRKPMLEDQLRDSSLVAEAVTKGITEIGYQLSYAQDRALFVVQQLLDETAYEGNDTPHKPVRGSVYRFSGFLPVLNIKTSEFLELYGVKRYKRSKQIIFSAQARRVAINALKDLVANEHLLVYEKSIETDRKRKVRIEAIASLLKLEWLNNGRRVRMIPNPILVDHVKSYFILKPVGFFNLVEDKDIAKIRFLEYLLYHGFQQKRQNAKGKKKLSDELRIEVESIAYWLRMESMITGRKKSALRKRLKDLYEFGVKSGYLESFDVDQPGTKRRTVDVLRLSSTAKSKV